MLNLDWPAAEKRAASSFRPLPDRKPTNPDNARYAAAVFVLAVCAAILMAAFFIGRGTALSKANDIAADAIAEATEAQNLASAFKAERDSIEASMTALESRMDDLESDLTSATRAAELWEARALDASSTAASVQADNEALKRDLARIQQQKREAPATSSATQASTTTSTTGWQSAKASWYGSECFGNLTANGTPYNASAWGVAHRSLPFGTQVQISYNGKTVTAPVFDRGPFVGGREFDLSHAVAKSLGFGGVHTVRWRVM